MSFLKPALDRLRAGGSKEDGKAGSPRHRPIPDLVHLEYGLLLRPVDRLDDEAGVGSIDQPAVGKLHVGSKQTIRDDVLAKVNANSQIAGSLNSGRFDDQEVGTLEQVMATQEWPSCSSCSQSFNRL